jgi:hypothetical protein
MLIDLGESQSWSVSVSIPTLWEDSSSLKNFAMLHGIWRNGEKINLFDKRLFVNLV